MLSIKDYRNGRYQGFVRSNQPHGVGIFMHINLTFIIAEWQAGQISGKCIAVYPDGSIFSGQVRRGQPQGLTVWQLEKDGVKVIRLFGPAERQKMVVVAPLENRMFQVSILKLQITKQHIFHSNQQKALIKSISAIMELQENEVKALVQYQNCYFFFQTYFCRQYPQIFQQLVITINGYKEYWMGFREQGLGIRLQPIKEIQNLNNIKFVNQQGLQTGAHRCLDGHVYMIREMGMMNRQNLLVQYGLKSTNQLLRGFTIQQGVFQLEHTLVRYQSTTERPKICQQTFANHLKRSLHYINQFMEIQLILQIKRQMNRISEEIVTHQNQFFAHSIIQTPNKIVIKEIPKGIPIKGSKGENPQNRNDLNQKLLSRDLMKGKELASRLDEVKKQIYGSIKLKKSNKKSINIDYTNISRLNETASPNKPKQNESIRKTIQQESLKRHQIIPVAYNHQPTQNTAKISSKQRRTGSITPKKRQNIRQFVQRSPQKQSDNKSVKRQKSGTLRTRPAYIMKDSNNKQLSPTKSSKKIEYRQSQDRYQASLKQPLKDQKLYRTDQNASKQSPDRKKVNNYDKNSYASRNQRNAEIKSRGNMCKKKLLTEPEFVY